MLYASAPGRRTRQVLADVAVAGWVILWAQVGRWVHDLVALLATPTRELHEAGTSIGEGLRSAGGRVGELPLVGERLAETFRTLAGAGDQVGDAGASLTETILRLATTLGLITALGPILSVVIPWLIARARFVRQHRAAQALIHGHGPGGAEDAAAARPYDAPNLELFALRALSHQPLPVLARIDRDPVGAWRRGDLAVTEELARLELRATGIVLPRRTSRSLGRRR